MADFVTRNMQENYLFYGVMALVLTIVFSFVVGVSAKAIQLRLFAIKENKK